MTTTKLLFLITLAAGVALVIRRWHLAAIYRRDHVENPSRFGDPSRWAAFERMDLR